ncbi:Hypothetical predicted protein [Xyrichtys novacula]|uniref:Uncharacterized protein n=1 Tax=Xyrichtys novacula TaxID=13765 RepID=A0AAV1F1G5_XYRNO|nr:Hypothetical predicted protein [Xyrichtys novacula]
MKPVSKPRAYMSSTAPERTTKNVPKHVAETSTQPQPSSRFIPHSSQHMLISAYRGVPKTPKSRLILLITGGGSSSFSAVSEKQALNVTLPLEGMKMRVCLSVCLRVCVCVPCRLAGSVTLEQEKKMRVSVLWTARCLNFPSEPLPDVDLSRAAEGGAASVLF